MIFLTFPCFLVFGFFVILTSQAGTDVEALRGRRLGRKSQLTPKVQSLSILNNTSKPVGPSGLSQTGPKASARQKKWGPTPTLQSRTQTRVPKTICLEKQEIKTNSPSREGREAGLNALSACAGQNRTGRGNFVQTIMPVSSLSA